MPHKTAFVLPPFANEYPGAPFEQLPGFKDFFNHFLDTAAHHTDPGLIHFGWEKNNFLEDELRSQYMAYTIGCAVGDYLRQHHSDADIYAGYSMGLYSALYLSGAIPFVSGLDIIRDAYGNIIDLLPSGKYAMASITGLNREDIHQLCIDHRLGTEIAIQNSVCSFLISGKNEEVMQMTELAKQEGALNTRILNVSVPYHSHFLRQISNTLGQHLVSIAWQVPKKPVISLVDQRVIFEEYEIRREIIRNIYTPLNWYKTQITLQDSGYKTFVECGPGKALVKNSRFIEGNATFVNANAWFTQKYD